MTNCEKCKGNLATVTISQDNNTFYRCQDCFSSLHKYPENICFLCKKDRLNTDPMIEAYRNWNRDVIFAYCSMSCMRSHKSELKERGSMAITIKIWCQFCSKSAKIECSVCHDVCYCSQTCLEADWPRHLKSCKKSK